MRQQWTHKERAVSYVLIRELLTVDRFAAYMKGDSKSSMKGRERAVERKQKEVRRQMKCGEMTVKRKRKGSGKAVNRQWKGGKRAAERRRKGSGKAAKKGNGKAAKKGRGKAGELQGLSG